jgi:tRNA threonylcarbamoyladenosine biosynthesis protein TsaE
MTQKKNNYFFSSAELRLRSPAATRRLGRKLGAALQPGDFVALTGDLGAGKTLLVKAAAEGAGVSEPATSPSFALINVYRGGRVPLQHVDLYRLAGPAELFALGFDDLLAEPAATLCEWAEKAGKALPPDRLDITLEVAGPKSRKATLSATGDHGARLLAALGVRLTSRDV